MVQITATGRFIRLGFLCGALVASVTILARADTTGQNPAGDVAQQILDAADLKGGLIVHLGCGDGRLTAALRAGDSYLVHGLDSDAEAVRQAREHIRKLGIYGPVAVERFDGKRLPYAENLMNLVVAEELGSVGMEEVMRVLAPGGAVCLEQDGRWTKTVKPRPADIDEWTHYLHDASGNAVAHDELVGPPGRLQWTAQPRHTRSHEHIPSICALVSAGGRIFYIVDQAPVGSIRQLPQWHLVARDAFNGILLWKRPIAAWFPHIVNWGQTPRQLQRKLVAVGDRVYVTLGLHAPLCAVDAATGETLTVYENTRGTEEIVFHRGILLLVVRSVTDQRIAELEKWAQLVQKENSPVYARDSAEPLVRRLRAVEGKADRTILALDAETGHVLWKKEGADTAGLRTLSLCAGGRRAFYQKARDVVCLDLETGQERWTASSAPLRLVWEGSLFCVGGKTVTALSAETGKTQWTQATLLVDVRDVFVAGGSLWLGGFKPFPKKRGPAWGPYFVTQRDLASGEVLRHIEPENPGHHHRCYTNKATDRYILGGRRGTEFIDLSSGEVLWHSWARGVCKYGVMPSNGLLYAPPHACGCYVAAKLTGFNALAARRDEGPAARDKSPAARDEGSRLERGPAYDGPLSGHRAWHSADWPAYRHDAQRSGSTPAPVPAVLRQRWQVQIGGPRPAASSRKLTAPTVAEGKVFVASVDEHTICAVDADSGQPAWQFTAGARVDSPPTLHQGRAIFGCRDGYVYSLRAADGALAWRLRTAREDRRIVARGQLESTWPVLGSVLLRDGVAYCTAGRSSYLDGGIDLCRLQAETGKLLSRTPIYSPDPQTGKQPPQFAPAVMPGTRADILAADAGNVYLRDMVFDPQGVELPEGSPHLFTLTDFLDDTWSHRSYWIFGTRPSLSTGCSGRERSLVYGRLLVFDKSTIYGYGRTSVHWSNRLEDGPYRLFAVKRGAQTVKRDKETELWAKPLGVTVRAMVLAGEVLFVAGPPAPASDIRKARDAGRPALVMAVSATDGTVLAQHPLDCPPVFDGMAAAGGRLYLCLENGRVVCLDEKGTQQQ